MRLNQAAGRGRALRAPSEPGGPEQDEWKGHVLPDSEKVRGSLLGELGEPAPCSAPAGGWRLVSVLTVAHSRNDFGVIVWVSKRARSGGRGRQRGETPQHQR